LASTVRKSQQEEQHIRTLGLEGLIIIIRSLGTSSGFTNVGSKLKIIGTVDELNHEKNKILVSDFEHLTKSGDDVHYLDEDISDSSDLNAGAVSNSSMNIVEVFDKKQKIQEEIEIGILKFNLSAKKGLAYLSGLGHVELTPKGVAEFFRQYQDRLDKTAVGDYLGREREYEGGFCLRVLHEYVQSMDFTDMAFDMAIRFFLGGFRLPGEAQKIDRLMEKFAERYYLQNRDSFASADMAFILAFSTIMLQTDLHNPSIRDDKRMTKDQFIKQNKGISPDGELSDEMLSDIYDRIAAEPISITADDKTIKKSKKDDQNSFVMFQATTDRRKKDAFNTERKEMVRAGEAMIKLNSRRGSVFVRNSAQSDEAYVRPMFDVVWPSVLGVLSQILETYDDSQMVQLCLSGFQNCIVLSCRLDFPIARHTFINALAKFTTLDTVREMREKNVLCIKLLLSVALSEGDFLEESWTQVLQSISQLARLQLLANGSHTDDVFFSDSTSTASNGNITDGFKNLRRSGSIRTNSVNQEKAFDPFTKLFMGPSRAEATRLIEETNSELILREVDPVLVDKVYLNSITLSGDSVCHFVKSLCAVSLLEISISSSMNSLRGKDSSTDSSTPRIFSMQKLVEVADFNMHSRSRLDWSSIWALLAHHFSNVGLNENEALAMYAIDSLKQLSIKFLQKDELSNFNFQRLFLKPFEIIMSKSRSITTKDLILRCIDIMIRACACNIHSGWRSIFVIFEVAAGQDAKEIATISFDITEQLMNSQFNLLIYDFVELMNCLVAFVSSVHTPLSLKALSYLAVCADHLADGRITPAIESKNMFPMASLGGNTLITVESLVADEESSVFRLWWPLLLGLSTAVADNRLLVRVKALDTLQSVLRKNGHLFSTQTWSVIFKGVLFPMIDSAKTDNTIQPRSAWPNENPPASQNRLSWIGTMSSSALGVCVELFFLFKENTVHILPDLISMLEECISQDIESLAVIGLKVFRDLITTLGHQYSDRSFNGADLVCSRVTSCMVKNLCVYFGEAGFVCLDHPEIPLVIKNVLKDCPLSSRRKSKEMSLSGVAGCASNVLSPYVAGDCVFTTYGPATVVEVTEV
jgi:brefeldin A-inhibited guanine nucleotide-exchange protein